MLLILFVHYLSRNGDFWIRKQANVNINTWLTVIRWLFFCFNDSTALDFTWSSFSSEKVIDESLYSFFSKYSFTRKFKALFSSGRMGSWRGHEAVLTSECLTRMCQIPHQLSELFLTFQVYPPEFQDWICSFSSPGREFHSLNKWEEGSVWKDA